MKFKLDAPAIIIATSYGHVLSLVDGRGRDTKSQIKKQFMSFFKTKDVEHLASKKLKTTGQKPTKRVQEYDKIFKDLLSQLEYKIDEQLLIQWFVAGLLQKTRMHIRLDNFNTYANALTKALQIEMDEDYLVNPVDRRLEEQLEIMQKSIMEISLKGHEV